MSGNEGGNCEFLISKKLKRFQPYLPWTKLRLGLHKADKRPNQRWIGVWPVQRPSTLSKTTPSWGVGRHWSGYGRDNPFAGVERKHKAKFPVNRSLRETRTQKIKLQERKRQKAKNFAQSIGGGRTTAGSRHRWRVVEKTSSHNVWLWCVECTLWRMSTGRQSCWRWIEGGRAGNLMVWSV